MSEERIVRSPTQPKAGLGQAYADLITDREFIRSVLANSTEAIKLLDLDARIEFLSAGALRLMDADDLSPLIGTPWLALWRDDAQALAAAAVAEARAGRTGTFEGARQGDNGNATWWDVSVSPVAGADGKPARLLVMARDVTERKRARQSQQAMRQELHHRVKNTLAMAMGIASQSLSRARDVTEGRLAVEQRLMALAEAHDLLHAGGADDASLRQIVGRAISPYDTVPSRFAVTGADVSLSSPAALAIAMAVHELCTNAVKHGALSVKSGRIDVGWRVADARFHWAWRERGGPAVQAPTRRGFGMRVIEAGFRDQLGGSMQTSFEAPGFACAVEAPLAALRGATDRAGPRP